MAARTQHITSVLLITTTALVVLLRSAVEAVPTPTFVGDTDTVEGSGDATVGSPGGSFSSLPASTIFESDEADTVDRSIGRLIDHIPAETIRDLVHDHCMRDAITRRALRFAFSAEGARRRQDFMRMPEVQEHLRWLEQHGVNVNATMQRLLFVFGIDKAAELKTAANGECQNAQQGAYVYTF